MLLYRHAAIHHLVVSGPRLARVVLASAARVAARLDADCATAAKPLVYPFLLRHVLVNRRSEGPLLLRYVIGVGLISSLLAGPVSAQKDPGIVIPTAPTAKAPPVVQRRPAPAPLAAVRQPEADRDAAQLAQALPLDPATRDLRDRLPANVPAVERSLGLRPPLGGATDLRGQVPTPRQIVDALAPR